MGAFLLLILFLTTISFILALSWSLLLMYWWRPRTIDKALSQQGIKGLDYHFLRGNIPEYAALVRMAQSSSLHTISHDVVPQVMPYYSKWSQIHGEQFYYWYGWTPRLILMAPELIKEVLHTKSQSYTKLSARPEFSDLFGKGLPNINGDAWATHRRVLNPAFRLDKLKAMVPTMLECANAMFDKWERLCTDQSECEIEIGSEYVELTADVIARTAFGSSYHEGKHVFDMQRQQQILITEADRRVYIPGSRFLPTSKNRIRWGLQKQIHVQLQDIISKRMEAMGDNNIIGDGFDYCKSMDLLGLMLMANLNKDKKANDNNYSSENTTNSDNNNNNNNKPNLSLQDVVDECKTFLFAGHETTSSLLTWTTMLLAHHDEWQVMARAEVLQVCGSTFPTFEAMGHLKIMTMILHESLRLYPPVVHMIRYGLGDIKLGGLHIPKGTGLLVPILALHHSNKIWGDDANEFKPKRFAQGVAKATKQPIAYMPFSFGPRVCIGQNFSFLEAKLIMSILLQRFTFRISPSYKHAPSHIITIQPKYGMHIILKPISLPSTHVT